VNPQESPHRDRNDERLQRACDLLIQVADDLQAALNAGMLGGISEDRAGHLIRLACQVDTLNRLAAETWDIKSARLVSAQVRARLAAADG